MNKTVRPEQLESLQAYDIIQEPIITEEERRCLECGVQTNYDTDYCKDCQAGFDEVLELERERMACEPVNMVDYARRLLGY